MLTGDTPASERVVGQLPLLNGKAINVRLTHPSLYRLILLSGVVSIALGLNFMLANPTFKIFGQSNYLWSLIFLLLGMSEVVFLALRRSLQLVRVSLALSFVYIAFIGLGTMKPFIDGTGSLQLPILYFGWAFLQAGALLEPFINPLTARRDV